MITISLFLKKVILRINNFFKKVILTAVLGLGVFCLYAQLKQGGFCAGQNQLSYQCAQYLEEGIEGGELQRENLTNGFVINYNSSSSFESNASVNRPRQNFDKQLEKAIAKKLAFRDLIRNRVRANLARYRRFARAIMAELEINEIKTKKELEEDLKTLKDNPKILNKHMDVCLAWFRGRPLKLKKLRPRKRIWRR